LAAVSTTWTYWPLWERLLHHHYDRSAGYDRRHDHDRP
jgi:hypothetical protein